MKNKKTLTVNALILFIAFSCSNPNPVTIKSADDWKKTTYEQKKLWLEYYLQNPDDIGYQLISLTEDAIKERCTYPSTAKVRATFVGANVVEADSGFVVKTGTLTAKNAFGLELRANYSVTWKITPFTLDIIRIDVDEID